MLLCLLFLYLFYFPPWDVDVGAPQIVTFIWNIWSNNETASRVHMCVPKLKWNSQVFFSDLKIFSPNLVTFNIRIKARENVSILSERIA